MDNDGLEQMLLLKVKEAKDNGLKQMLLLRNFEMQLFWMRYALNTMHISGEYEKYKTKVEKINDTLGKAERAIVRLSKEIRVEQWEHPELQDEDEE